MRYPEAIWYPGPAEKQGYAGTALNECRGVICHSMVGTFEGAKTRLEDVSKDANGGYTANAAASWHFSVLQSGKVLQHYDSAAVAWHAGSRRYNALLIGIEHEGGFNPTNEPLTAAQAAASVALVRWLHQVHGKGPMERYPQAVSPDAFLLTEHNEVYQTACPSHRIPWSQYTQEAEMASAEYDELKGALAVTNKLLAGLAAQTKELGYQQYLIASGRADEAKARIEYEAKAGGVTLP